MTSTRLPGKVLRPILGRPMLSFQIERLRRVRGLDALVVATTVRSTDDPIVAFCEHEGIACTRGSEEDVLARYFDAATRFEATDIVRLTSDCPLLDPQVVDRVLEEYRLPGLDCDYASNMLQPTFPYGMAVEVISRRALQEAFQEARDPAEREHVTPFIYWRPGRFRLRSVTMIPNFSHHRWTVDSPEDFELVSRILDSIYPDKPGFLMDDVLTLLRLNPDWEEINRAVQQKIVTSGPRVN